ncbi:anucleate primary sterigmata protein B [Uncinocarpus reesii 1704]|uniref:Anucleate primary sterigmata protein B n=1 Tax=Uncinocarpus reesii (strain UAMH 1704) TaxID=336963 RepID=C4JWK2_UNCRE|nr:anucleate primary sterigmata protein B [Uncinocarpus reesii 1704]EEP82079.1 anucleate primary sterigmata protein B [Uncinocarpus reesii 1704]
MGSISHTPTSIPPSSPPLSPHQQFNDPCPGDHNKRSPTPEDDQDTSGILPLPPPTIRISNDDSITHNVADDDDAGGRGDDELSIPNQTMVEEREMHRRLMDVESSFLPEPSAIRVGEGAVGLDDTYLVGVDLPDSSQVEEQSSPSPSPSRPAPANLDKHIVPAPTTGLGPSVFEDKECAGSLEHVPSLNSETSTHADAADHPPWPATATEVAESASHSFSAETDANSENGYDHGEEHSVAGNIISSLLDFILMPMLALTTPYSRGGAVPANNDLRPQSERRQKRELSRSTSLGSMASGISGYSDENPLERRAFSGISEPNLHTLDEEDVASQSRPTSSGKTAEGNAEDDAAPMTPKARAIELPLPTDTVIAQHVQDIQVPGTFARQFRDSHLSLNLSPDKRGAPTPGFSRGKNMTLKEQSSTIDRLSKENFDLKMRIHFLNEALNKRSEEGIKEMISENVELKSGKLKLQKDNQALRKKIRELEKQFRDHGNSEKGDIKDDAASGSEEERAIMEEEEVIYLRERVETYEEEIERLRSESIARESEKRRLAEMVKSLSDGRIVESDAGAREERDMWKAMLDAETAAREQAEEENRRLRDEILRIKGSDAVSTAHSRSTRRRGMSSVLSQSDSDRDAIRSAARRTATSSTHREIELLQQENAELRREVSAQTSMLTSRNREKERLYQEIEELKLQRRFDGRSIAGDSIFERSASRAQDRSASRASDGTRASRMSDTERESLESKNGELRDQVSTLKLENQGLRAQLDEYMSEIESMDRAYQEDMDRAEEQIQSAELARDQAMQLAEEREAELQDLKAEAQDEINALEDELDMKTDDTQRLDAELRNQEENLRALQAEMRSANEGILRLEEDAQNNLQKYKTVQLELEDANRELETLEKNLFESNGKVQRLTVQLESSQNEIAFLREEQDGDKIKIGDLESELTTTQMSLQSEKERARELDSRLAEERHQREVVGSKEKQEVQRLMNELNRENTGAREDIRKLKKALSAREIEANTWKERLFELESSLREALGDLNGTRSSLLMSITKLQKELESTTLELQRSQALQHP